MCGPLRMEVTGQKETCPFRVSWTHAIPRADKQRNLVSVLHLDDTKEDARWCDAESSTLRVVVHGLTEIQSFHGELGGSHTMNHQTLFCSLE